MGNSVGLRTYNIEKETCVLQHKECKRTAQKLKGTLFWIVETQTLDHSQRTTIPQ